MSSVGDNHVPKLSGWGRVAGPGVEAASEELAAACRGAALTRGLGRSYGDSSLPPPGGLAASSRLADRILSFEPGTGHLRAEAGLSVRALNRLFLPRRWFLPVTPGTQDVTVGGLVASDVHGKNHHRDGTIGRYVERLRMRVADGRVLDVSRSRHPDLFRATLGGMGLTGHIFEVTLRMRRIPTPWIATESRRVPDIDRYVRALKEAGPRWPYTMGWIDCLSGGRRLGRGILMCGRWAEPGEAPRFAPRPLRRVRVPFVLPEWVLSPLTVRLFNEAYYVRHPRVRRGIVHPETFFYPLDAIGDWNRLYGPRGFTQHQCVLPEESVSRSGARRLLQLLSDAGAASFLCVIKDCGAEGEGLLSFPMPGISVAVDLPVRDDTEELVARLNEFVIAEGGRVYLTKDRFTTERDFRRMESRLPRFLEIRRRWDPESRIRSAQSVRLFGDRP